MQKYLVIVKEVAEQFVKEAGFTCKRHIFLDVLEDQKKLDPHDAPLP